MKNRTDVRSTLSLVLIALLSTLLVSAANAQTGIQFNGSSQYVTFGTATALDASSFTVECWFKRTAAGTTTTTGTGGVTAVPLVTKGRGRRKHPPTST